MRGTLFTILNIRGWLNYFLVSPYPIVAPPRLELGSKV